MPRTRLAQPDSDGCRLVDTATTIATVGTHDAATLVGNAKAGLDARLLSIVSM